MIKRLPLQPAGWVVLAVGCASLVGALALNWRELLVLAIGCGAVLLFSVLFIIGRSDIRLERRLVPERVTIGEPAIAELHASNPGSLRSSKQMIRDEVDGESVEVALPAIGAGESTVEMWTPPTDRRGVRKLGPARITKADPCRLMQRDVGQTGIDTLWVQPRVVAMPSFAAGLTKDMDGPTFDHSPAGDVAFHAIRPYRIGDDARHVHWMATARAGEMMVRHYVDNRQPFVSVLIDTHVDSWASETELDAAVDIAASLGVTALTSAQPVAVYGGRRSLVGAHKRSMPSVLLDDLTLLQTDTDGLNIGRSLSTMIAAERNTTVTVVLTGTTRDTDQLADAATALARQCRVLLVRVGEADTHERPRLGRGVRLLNVQSVDEFAASLGREITVQ